MLTFFFIVGLFSYGFWTLTKRPWRIKKWFKSKEERELLNQVMESLGSSQNWESDRYSEVLKHKIVHNFTVKKDDRYSYGAVKPYILKFDTKKTIEIEWGYNPMIHDFMDYWWKKTKTHIRIKTTKNNNEEKRKQFIEIKESMNKALTDLSSEQKITEFNKTSERVLNKTP